MTIFTDEFFSKLKDEKIKTFLEDIKNGNFRTYGQEKYDTEIRDELKKYLHFTFPTSLVSVSLRFILDNHKEVLEYIKTGRMTKAIADFCKANNIEKKHFMVFAREFIKSDAKGLLKKIKDAGEKTFIFYFTERDKKSDKEQKEENKSDKKEESKSDSKSNKKEESKSDSKSNKKEESKSDSKKDSYEQKDLPLKSKAKLEDIPYQSLHMGKAPIHSVLSFFV